MVETDLWGIVFDDGNAHCACMLLHKGRLVGNVFDDGNPHGVHTGMGCIQAWGDGDGGGDGGVGGGTVWGVSAYSKKIFWPFQQGPHPDKLGPIRSFKCFLKDVICFQRSDK